jgi:hypothetical protein
MECEIKDRKGMRHPTQFLTAAFFLAAINPGCGDSASYELAPVSGVVTLDGKPVPQALVVFQPIGGEDNPTPGPSSSAAADSEGWFELKTVQGESGAVVGKHRVKITTPSPAPPSDTDSGFAQPVHKEIIPSRYNSDSELTFEVPADGTTEANFPLKSR